MHPTQHTLNNTTKTIPYNHPLEQEENVRRLPRKAIMNLMMNLHHRMMKPPTSGEIYSRTLVKKQSNNTSKRNSFTISLRTVERSVNRLARTEQVSVLRDILSALESSTNNSLRKNFVMLVNIQQHLYGREAEAQSQSLTTRRESNNTRIRIL